jgi:iron complex outermembrane receptor protein
MRITLTQLLLSFVFCGITLANDAFSQEVLNKSISLKPETITVKRALTQIERLADVKFIYSPNLIQSERKVNLSFDNNRLSTILNEFLTPLNISYEVVGNRIVLSKKEIEIVPQTTNTKELPNVINADINVTGQVTDEKGQPLTGVSVLVKGSTRGTTSDGSGNFKIAVPDNDAVLVFSFVGYKKQEVSVAGRSKIMLSLQPENQNLEEVVVVGYGTQSRKNLVSAVTTIKPEELNKGAISDVGQLLQGKVPGLNITRSGDPNRSAAIILRGASTLRDGAQSPLL